MPNLDRTGPMGRGERTGRGMGHCTDNGPENYSQRGYGYGRGRGFGGGRGRGRGHGRGPGRGFGRGYGRGPERGFRPEAEIWPIVHPGKTETTLNDSLRQELEFLKTQQAQINEAIQAIENKLSE